MQLCLALDLASEEENLKLLDKLKDFSKLWVKVGLRSFIRDGQGLLSKIKMINPNFKIFLDLKLYDIPNTMADAVESCANLGIDMITIHTSSGREAMKTLMQRLQTIEASTHKKRPLVFGVTALTSFDDQGFSEIYHNTIQEQASSLGKIAYESRLDGVVCSVFESLQIKNVTHSSFLTLTPGIRPFNEDAHDQKRVATILDAKKNCSDFIVVGRPIYQSKTPKEVVQKILEEIQGEN